MVRIWGLLPKHKQSCRDGGVGSSLWVVPYTLIQMWNAVVVVFWNFQCLELRLIWLAECSMPWWFLGRNWICKNPVACEGGSTVCLQEAISVARKWPVDPGCPPHPRTDLGFSKNVVLPIQVLSGHPGTSAKVLNGYYFYWLSASNMMVCTAPVLSNK